MPTLDASGDDDDIGVSLEGFEDGIVFVAHQTRKVDETSVALDEGREHRPVGVGDTKTTRVRARRQ